MAPVEVVCNCAIIRDTVAEKPAPAFHIGGKQTITEPSAVAPDAEVKLSIKSIAQLMANVHFSIRRYRARFCNGFCLVPEVDTVARPCGQHSVEFEPSCRFQTEPVPLSA